MTSPRFRRLAFATVVTAAVALLAPIVATPTPASANSLADLSEVGQEAFADLTTCLRSADNKTIDVFYLVDDSDSLLNTDPEVVREEILSDSVLQLASFAEQGISVNVGAALFSTAVTPVFTWRAVQSPSDAAVTAGELSSAITASATRTGSVKWTNWEAGLTYASDQLDEINPDKANCQALIWFTDGGIRLGQDKTLSLPSLASLCHSGIGAERLDRRTTDNLGLMASFRERKIGVFAVLFKNEQALRAPANNPGLSAQEIAEKVGDFRYFASFMLPLVEGSGEIYGDYTPPGFPAGDVLECANLGPDGKAIPGEANGAFLDAEDPIALAFQFLKLQAEIEGGDSKEIGDNGAFQIDQGTAAFRILTTSFDWTLTGPEGAVQIGPDAGPPQVNLNPRTGVTTIDVTVDELTGIGNWTFSPQEDTSFSSLYVFAGLTIDLDRSQETPIVLGRDNTLAGQVVRQSKYANMKMDLSVYEQNAMRLEIIQPDGLVPVENVTIEGPDAQTGSFRIAGFNPDTSLGESLNVQLTLSLGGDFEPIKSRFTLNVLSSGAFPLIENSVITLSSLDGPEGVAEGEMRVVPPVDVASGEFCIAHGPKRVSDSQPQAIEPVEREAQWNWTFSADRQTRSDNSFTCFEVPAGDSAFVITVNARNSLQADSSVESIHTTTSGDLGQAPMFDEDVVFAFESRTQQSAGVFLGVFIALLVLGIVLPLVLLYLFNRIASRFAWANGMVRAEFPVLASLGFLASLADRSSGSSLRVGPQSFQFVADRRDPRSVEDEPHGYPVARVPLFPLSATWTEWIANLGSRVVSSYDGSTKTTSRFVNGKAAEISPRMSDNWALVFNEQELLASSDDGPIPATLVVYSEMKDLAGYDARIREIEATPGLVERIRQVKQAVQQEIASNPGNIGPGGSAVASNNPAPPPLTPTPSLNLPGAPPPPGS